MLSPRWDTIILILLGLTATAASFLVSGEWSPVSTIVLRRGGNILAFSALSWVVARAVYAPGRITLRRLQGAVVLYLSLATIFASAYGLMWELSPGAFVNVVTPLGGPEEVATMLYFSLTTLTTTGYGDIVPVDPFARSLANLESVLGQFFLAITVTRLVRLDADVNDEANGISRVRWGINSEPGSDRLHGFRVRLRRRRAASGFQRPPTHGPRPAQPVKKWK